MQLSSYSAAGVISDSLKSWIEEGKILISKPIESLPGEAAVGRYHAVTGTLLSMFSYHAV